MQHTFILSLPRSGSTVLTRMLSSRNDVMCLPETFFPHLADHLTTEEWAHPRWIGALFVASCSDGSPLTIEEAASCSSIDPHATLERMAVAVATKEGRDSTTLNAVVWKSTRLVGSIRTAMATGGRFVILHRPRLNVFESQFRVPFGQRNKNPARFALFAASYDAAFRSYPQERTLHLDYADIPQRLCDIYGWIGSRDARAYGSAGALHHTAGRRAWHQAIDKPFMNDDTAKLTNLSQRQKAIFQISETVLSRMPAIACAARHRADLRQADALREQAHQLLLSHCA